MFKPITKRTAYSDPVVIITKTALKEIPVSDFILRHTAASLYSGIVTVQDGVIDVRYPASKFSLDDLLSMSLPKEYLGGFGRIYMAYHLGVIEKLVE